MKNQPDVQSGGFDAVGIGFDAVGIGFGNKRKLLEDGFKASRDAQRDVGYGITGIHGQV